MHEEDLRAGDVVIDGPESDGVKEFIVSREFRVYARSADEAAAELESQLQELAHAALTVKHIVAILQRVAAEDAASHKSDGLPPLPLGKDAAKKDFGPN